jgi:hypothetical protein
MRVSTAAIVDPSLGLERVEVRTRVEPATARPPTIEPTAFVGVGDVAFGLRRGILRPAWHQ